MGPQAYAFPFLPSFPEPYGSFFGALPSPTEVWQVRISSGQPHVGAWPGFTFEAFPVNPTSPGGQDSPRGLQANPKLNW